MLRPRHFGNDIRIGKIGEDTLRNRLVRLRSEGRIQMFVDETKKPSSQRDDIDFRVILNDGNEVTYECKTDAYGLKTRNISYEITSHDYSGCLARSNADYIHYVFVDEQNTVVEEYAIILSDWRKWIGMNSVYIVPYSKGNDCPLQMFYSQDIGVLQLLCNIDCMVRDNVARKL